MLRIVVSSALLLSSALLTIAAPDRPAADEACPSTGLEAVEIAAVEPRLELRLVDGRRVRLAGLDPALSTPDEPDRDERAQAAFAALVAHRAITLRPLAKTQDRWGRIVAFAFAADGAAGGLAAQAIGAGLARYLSETAAHACRAILVAAEDRARAATLGLWEDPYYAVLSVDDRDAFTERAGTMILIEGKLHAVTTGPARASLVFADRSDRSHAGQAFAGQVFAGRMFSATITPRVMKTFEAGGVRFSSLIGQTLRLRGLLDLRFGPQIELTGPDDVDVVSAQQPAAALARPNAMRP